MPRLIPLFSHALGDRALTFAPPCRYYRNMVVIVKKDPLRSPDVAPLGEYMHRHMVEEYGAGHEAWRKTKAV
jgi:hypothetical protein